MSTMVETRNDCKDIRRGKTIVSNCFLGKATTIYLFIIIYLFIYLFIDSYNVQERTIGHVVPYLVRPPNPTP